MDILKISFQYSTYTETPFYSEVDKTTLSKQTPSFYVSKEIKTTVIFRTHLHLLNRIRTHECSRVNILFSIILDGL